MLIYTFLEFGQKEFNHVFLKNYILTNLNVFKNSIFGTNKSHTVDWY